MFVGEGAVFFVVRGVALLALESWEGEDFDKGVTVDLVFITGGGRMGLLLMVMVILGDRGGMGGVVVRGG